MSTPPDDTRSQHKPAPSRLYCSTSFPPTQLPSTDFFPLPSSLNIFTPWSLHKSAFDCTKLGHSEHIGATVNYPSPPSTDPYLLANSPLPAIPLSESKCHLPTLRIPQFGGILNSSRVMYHEAVKRSAPLSPPASLPTSTSFFQTEDDFSYSPEDMQYLHFLEDDSDPDSPSLSALTPSTGSSCSTLLSPISPTSPESPEWYQQSFPSPGVRSSLGSVLLRNNSLDTSPTSSIDVDGSNLHDRRLEKQQHTSPKRPLLSPLTMPQPYNLLSWPSSQSPKDINQPHDLDPLDIDDTELSLPSFTQPLALHEEQQEQVQTPSSSTTSTGAYDVHPPQHILATSPPFPQHNFPHESSPSIHSSNLPDLDELHDLDMDFLYPTILDEPPSSPSLRSYTMLPEDDDQERYIPAPRYPHSTEDTPMFSPPESPGHTLLSLPGADTDDDLLPFDLAPNLPHILNRDKIPSIHDYSTSKSTSYTNPLLIIDDDSPPHPGRNQRSPSPEPCAFLDMDLVMNEFPEDDELRRVCGLLKKTRDAERAARQMEGLVEEEEKVNGSIMGTPGSGGGGGGGTLEAWTRLVNARRKTKRTKEKVREVATLLRLKLAQRGWKVGKDVSGSMGLIPITSPTSMPGDTTVEDEMKVDPHHKVKSAPKNQHITSPQQLVVKMIMDRHEPKHNSRPTAPGLTLGRKAHSPLARQSLSADQLETSAQGEDVGIAARGSGDQSLSVPEGEMRESTDDDGQTLDGFDLGLGFLPMS